MSVHLSRKVEFPFVSIRFPRDLTAFLTEFSEQHRGVRLGRMFGWPAGYVGCRLFACVTRDGLIVRLPGHMASRELKGHGRRFLSNGKPVKSWVLYRPRNVVEARRLAPVLVLAVRHAAEQMALGPRPSRVARG